MQCRLVLLPLLVVLALPSRPAAALSSRRVYASDTKVGIQLKVWPGYDLAINFLPLHGVVKKARLGDPSHFVLSSDGNLCSQMSAGAPEQPCVNKGANVVFIRQIQAIHFPGLMGSADGSTGLTLIVEEPGGQKVYQFRLTPAKGEPEYTSLDIAPDSEKPLPLFSVPLSQRSSTPVTPNNVGGQQATALNAPPLPSEQKFTNSSLLPANQPRTSSLPAFPTGVKTPATVLQLTDGAQKADPTANALASTSASNQQSVNQSIDDANAATSGLLTANQKGQIKPYTTDWERAENAIAWLRRGQSREAAAHNAGLELSVLNQLIAWGQNHP